MESITQSQVLLAIAGGTCDDDLDAVFNVYKDRSKFVRNLGAVENYATITVGQKVELVNISPKYLAGMTGEVTDKDGKNFTVLLDPEFRAEAGRYVGLDGKLTRVKPNLIKSL